MITYEIFKSTLRKIFSGQSFIEDDDKITVQYNINDTERIILCQIDDASLLQSFNIAILVHSENLELYSNNSYEIAVEIDMITRRKIDGKPLVINDVDNRIDYKISLASFTYSIHYIIALAEALEKVQERRLLIRFKRTIDEYIFFSTKESTQVSFESLLTSVFGVQTLTISSERPMTIGNFQDLKTSFLFEYMYRTSTPIIDRTNVLDICHYNDGANYRNFNADIDIPPHKKYVPDVVDYYKLALASSDPYITYLSYYHILEYFYDEVFKRKLITDLRNRITNPDFSYRNDDKVFELASFIRNRLKMDVDAVQGDELECLKFVLEEYVNINDLKERIRTMDSSLIDYYMHNKITFCNAPTIAWKDVKSLITLLAKRIYSTRNALVHSKSGKNQDRFRPYKHERDLQYEIPLIRAIAEQIIINAGSTM